jgi:hypothetical protein
MSDYPVESGGQLRSGGSGPAEPVPAAALTPLAHEYLDQTRPWVRFMSILVFSGAALMVLAGFALVVMVMTGAMAARSSSGLTAVGGIALGFFYLALACLYIAPGIFLHRYAAAIRQLKTTCTSSALEDVIRHQKSFWRYVGVLSAVGLVVSVLLVVFAIIAGVLGAILSGHR